MKVCPLLFVLVDNLAKFRLAYEVIVEHRNDIASDILVFDSKAYEVVVFDCCVTVSF